MFKDLLKTPLVLWACLTFPAAIALLTAFIVRGIHKTIIGDEILSWRSVIIYVIILLAELGLLRLVTAAAEAQERAEGR